MPLQYSLCKANFGKATAHSKVPSAKTSSSSSENLTLRFHTPEDLLSFKGTSSRKATFFSVPG